MVPREPFDDDPLCDAAGVGDELREAAVPEVRREDAAPDERREPLAFFDAEPVVRLARVPPEAAAARV